jgi:hypothetical protein
LENTPLTAGGKYQLMPFGEKMIRGRTKRECVQEKRRKRKEKGRKGKEKEKMGSKMVK